MGYLELRNERLAKNKSYILERYSGCISDIYEFIDSSCEVFRSYSSIRMLDYIDDKFKGFASDMFMNNINYIIAALELNLEGQFAQARALYRNVYEALVITKYESIADEDTVLEKYLSGKSISLKKDVYCKIDFDKEKMKNIELFWSHLCSFSHTSQESLSLIDSNVSSDDEINMTFQIARILLCMNYHVFNSYCFTQNMKAKADRLIVVQDHADTPKMIREKCMKISKKIQGEMSGFSKSIMKIFRSKWKLKSKNT